MSDKRDPFRMLRNRIFDLAVWNSQFLSWKIEKDSHSDSHYALKMIQ